MKNLKVYEFRLNHHAFSSTIEAFSKQEAVTEINRIFPYAPFGEVKCKGYVPRQ